MRTVKVGTKTQLKKVLRNNGLTPTQLPELPVVIGNVRIECAHTRLDVPRNAGRGLTSWTNVCRTCGKRQDVWYGQGNRMQESSWY